MEKSYKTTPEIFHDLKLLQFRPKVERYVYKRIMIVDFYDYIENCCRKLFSGHGEKRTKEKRKREENTIL